MPELLGKVGHVVDLAADFRLPDPALYPRWYGEAHTAPELLGDFAYGLPELFRDEILAAAAVAAPGCYPTAAALALAPLVRGRAWWSRPGSSSTPPAGCRGRAGPPSRPDFGAVDEDFTAYGLLDHRHTPEMEQAIGADAAVHAAPGPDGARHPGHLLRPADRRGPTSTEDVLDLLTAGLRRRAVRGRGRRLAVDQGDARARTPPTSPPGSTRAPAG